MKTQIFFCVLGLLIVSGATRKINNKTIELIKEFESWKPCYYLDDSPRRYPTIGWGHKIEQGDNYEEGSCITMDEGEELLKKELTEKERCIEDMVKVPLSDNEFGALVSWAYNVGCGAARNSTLVKLINEGKKDETCMELRRWFKSAGKSLRGLIRRRERECELFKSTGDEPLPKFDLSCMYEPYIYRKWVWEGGNRKEYCLYRCDAEGNLHFVGAEGDYYKDCIDNFRSFSSFDRGNQAYSTDSKYGPYEPSPPPKP